MLYLKDLGVMESVGKENIFLDVDRALEAAENRMIEKHDPEATGPHCRWDFSDFAYWVTWVRNKRPV